MYRRSFVCLALVLSCTGDGSPSDEAGRRLSLVGDADVGLLPAGQAVLRVRYSQADGSPVAAGRVQFAIFGDPRGSTLSGDAAITDDNGEATVVASAGSASCSFEVRAQAAGSAPVSFYLEVSSAGFGSLAVRGQYLGTSADIGDLSNVRYQLLSGFVCAGINPLVPTTVLRERATASLDEPARFKALPLDVDHSILALASDGSSRLRAWGCVEIPRALPNPNHELSLWLPLDDFQPVIAGTFEVASDISLPPPSTDEGRALAPALAPFQALAACPRGPAQLLLDCIVDALDPGDPLDCVVEGASPNALAIQMGRGVLDNDGCRGQSNASGGTSLDNALWTLMSSAGKTELTALQALPAAALQSLRSFQISSTLEIRSASADGRNVVARHELQSITFRHDATVAQLRTSELGSPASVAEPVALLVSGWKANLLEHGFRLRFGRIARLALGQLLLSPAGLPASSPELVSVLAGLVSVKNLQSCPAIEALTCAAAHLSAGCLAKACAEGLQGLASYLDSGFESSLNESNDLLWWGEADLKDDNGDQQVERLGIRESPGIWRGHVMFYSDGVKLQEATFQAKRQ